MKPFKLLLIFNILFLFGYSYGQLEKSIELDSLIEVLERPNISQKEKFNTYLKISKNLSNKDRKRAFEFANNGLDFAKEKRNFEWMAKAYSNLGIIHIMGREVAAGDSLLNLAQESLNKVKPKPVGLQARVYLNRGTRLMFMGLLDSSIVFFNQAIGLSKNLKDQEVYAKSLNNKASAQFYMAKYQTSLITYFEALNVSEKIEDYSLASIQLGNIANIYNQTQQFNKAIQKGKEAHYLAKKVGNKYVSSAAIMTISGSFEQLNILDSALHYGLLGEKLKTELNDKVGLAIAEYNLAAVYLKQNKLNLAEKKLISAFETFEQIGNNEGIASCKASLGRIYLTKGETKKGTDLVMQAISLAKKNNLLNAEKDIYYEGSLGFHSAGNYKDAYEFINLHKQLSDSIRIATNLQGLDELQTIYQTEKQKNQILDLEKNQQIADSKMAEQNAEIKQKKTQQYALFGGLALVLVFAGFMFNRFRVTKKQKYIIEGQKSIVEKQKKEVELQKDKVDEAYSHLEEKNQEIMDSITYAKRIQSAILPPNKLIMQSLPNSFILYKPKDIVAGDFYWMEHKNDKILFAAADCTGHGVPGAMVSVVCNNGLNRSVREYGLTDPGKILDKTREIVIAEFEKSEEEVKDGMDVALCTLKGKTLQYAGAHNPIWIIRKNSEELEEIKANKQPIGKYTDISPYTTHQVELNEGDSFYIFSDGYADQFGGEKGKKFKSANFKRLLLSIQGESMARQKELLNEEFENWRGEIEQLDDVCVIGVRV